MTAEASSFAQPIQVGIAAFGASARTFHIPLVSAVPGLRLHAIASSRREDVRAAHPDAVIYDNAETMVLDPALELIVIATPNISHATLAEAALEAGKHVVVDKPFTLDTSSGERLVELSKQVGKTLAVFHNRRWDGDFLTVRRLIASGRLGRLVHFESHFDRFRPGVQKRWRESAEPGSGLWYDLGPHLVDQALQLFGRPQSVFADLACLRDGAEAVDYAHVLLGYGPLKVILHATALSAFLAPRFVLHGTEGSFVIDGLDPQEDALKAGEIPGERLSSGEAWGTGAPDGRIVTASGQAAEPRLGGDYRAFYAGVRDAIRSGAAPPVAPEEALDVMRILDAGRLSAVSGALVRL